MWFEFLDLNFHCFIIYEKCHFFYTDRYCSYLNMLDVKVKQFECKASLKCEVFAEFDTQPIIKVNLLNDFQDVFAKIEISASASFNDY